MANKNNLVVVAVFDDQVTADTAMNNLKEWNKRSKVMKLGAIGTLNMEGDDLKSRIPRHLWRGVVYGAIVGIIVSIFISNISVFIGLIAGAIIGGVLGSFFKKSTNLSKDDIQQLRNELTDGQVAVMATVDEYEIETTSGKLNSLGGKVLTFTTP